MQSMEKTISEVHSLLIEFEKSIKRNKKPIVGASSTPQVMAIQGGRVQKYKPQGKAKGKWKGKSPQNSYPTKPKSLNLTRKSVRQKMDNVTTVKRKDIGKGTILFTMNNTLYFNAITVNGIYEIDMRDSTFPIINSMYSISNKRTKSNLDSIYLWHCRLAHINKKRIEKLQHDGLLKFTDNEPFDQCVSCISGKMIRKSFSHKTEKVKDVLGLIHTDVCGPLRHVSKKGASHFITFTDDYSHYGYVHLLKHKHEVFETFKVFKSEVENQLRKTIKAILSDRGGEYISQEFKDYLKACEIFQQLTPPYTPQHNGVSERHNQCAVRILNMVPTKKVSKTPNELWHGKVPNLSYLKETMSYYFYYPPENKIVVERYADFLEKDFILQKDNGRIIELEDEDILLFENTSEHPIEEESLAPIVSQEEDVILVRRSVRTHKALDRLCLNVEIDPDRLCFNFEVEEHSLGDLNKPVLPSNAKVVKIKWIYKKKTDMDGKIRIYKARLVAKGYTQTYGVDYEEIFLPVADIRAIRILIAIAAYNDYEIWQMDVKTMFLNGFLEEEIYMEQHEGFIDPNHSRKASGSNVIFLILYVDDVILMGNHIPCLQEVKTYLGKCFSMKDLGEAAFILGIKIYRDRSRRLIGLSQNAYLDKILKRYRMDNSKRGSIPMKFIDELDVVPSNDFPIKKNCDNSAAIIMDKESAIQKGARHFKRKYHYVRECIKTGKIDTVKIHTYDNLVDLFTKALAGPKLT
nr:hypothetical protein [Tanacetum cinerariifolium]